jgi:hypothetical protein
MILLKHHIRIKATRIDPNWTGMVHEERLKLEVVKEELRPRARPKKTGRNRTQCR